MKKLAKNICVSLLSSQWFFFNRWFAPPLQLQTEAPAAEANRLLLQPQTESPVAVKETI